MPWEDEKYIFIAAARKPATIKGARVLMPPRIAGGVARLKLCDSDGENCEVMLSRRDGEALQGRPPRRLGRSVATDIINR